MDSKKLFETVFGNVKKNIEQTSKELFPEMYTGYIDDWFNANQENAKDANFIANFLSCTPEDIVNDIYRNFVCAKVAKKIVSHYKALEGKEKEIKCTLDNICYFDIFQSYYGSIRATEPIYIRIMRDLDLKMTNRCTFEDLKQKMAVMQVGGTINFAVRNPETTSTKSIVYTAFAAKLGNKTYYGFHSIKGNDWAAMADGFENITVELLRELVKYYGERFETYWEGSKPNPIVYVLN